jgi:4-hydroxybenzoate polyprenyltransferase
MAPVIAYPFMKRITHHPQIVLGLAFSWGALMGFAATLGSLPLSAILLYAGTVLWVVGYDTIYAVQDIEDDSIVGIGSTARVYGARAPRFVAVCYAGAVLFMAAAVWPVGGVASWLGLLGFAAHLGWQAARVDVSNPELALRLFRSNRDAGLIFFAGLAIDPVLRGLLS